MFLIFILFFVVSYSILNELELKRIKKEFRGYKKYVNKKFHKLFNKINMLDEFQDYTDDRVSHLDCILRGGKCEK